MRSALAALLTCSSLYAITREVAVTFDDLPANPAYAAKLLKAIRRSGAPAVGFVNENKLTSAAHTAVQAQWLEAGLELGNHLEEQSQKLFGRNIRHVLLVHGNRLNSDWFDELAKSMRKRGYRFVTLDRAVEDEAYRSADTFIGRGGISWIHRWALTAGKKGAFFAGEPATPTWIQDIAGIKE